MKKSGACNLIIILAFSVSFFVILGLLFDYENFNVFLKRHVYSETKRYIHDAYPEYEIDSIKIGLQWKASNYREYDIIVTSNNDNSIRLSAFPGNPINLKDETKYEKMNRAVNEYKRNYTNSIKDIFENQLASMNGYNYTIVNYNSSNYSFEDLYNRSISNVPCDGLVYADIGFHTERTMDDEEFIGNIRKIITIAQENEIKLSGLSVDNHDANENDNVFVKHSSFNWKQENGDINEIDIMSLIK